jgi:hypothetical protein
MASDATLILEKVDMPVVPPPRPASHDGPLGRVGFASVAAMSKMRTTSGARATIV